MCWLCVRLSSVVYRIITNVVVTYKNIHFISQRTERGRIFKHYAADRESGWTDKHTHTEWAGPMRQDEPKWCGLLTFSVVPGRSRSSSLHKTTPSFNDDCKKPSGSEMVFFGDSSTPRVMSHVTVCSAGFMVTLTTKPQPAVRRK